MRILSKSSSSDGVDGDDVDAVMAVMTIIGATTVLMEGLMLFVKDKDVVLCRRIQIIMLHKIQILTMIIQVT